MTDPECDVMDDTDGSQEENFVSRLGETRALIAAMDDPETGEATAREILMETQLVWNGPGGTRWRVNTMGVGVPARDNCVTASWPSTSSETSEAGQHADLSCS